MLNAEFSNKVNLPYYLVLSRVGMHSEQLVYVLLSFWGEKILVS